MAWYLSMSFFFQCPFRCIKKVFFLNSILRKFIFFFAIRITVYSTWILPNLVIFIIITKKVLDNNYFWMVEKFRQTKLNISLYIQGTFFSLKISINCYAKIQNRETKWTNRRRDKVIYRVIKYFKLWKKKLTHQLWSKLSSF